MKKVKDLKWGIEYEYDEVEKKIFKILTCYHTDGRLSKDRFEYEYIPEKFSQPY
ncbi:hypothetical protein [Zhenhengia yiwuensis]|uniref:Uncharacterized protein n=1 Tax=Zhenhengia yiwuensis TaxID=2763666 RepID=A0A926EM05_9FIRM|nr:hypothetical protein [Zhenhengia yiwuensis]MBC8580935.1 hypothetical protein [Zhenhengia yiwuensis]